MRIGLGLPNADKSLTNGRLLIDIAHRADSLGFSTLASAQVTRFFGGLLAHDATDVSPLLDSAGNVRPPRLTTINLDDPDPECNLCHVPNHARSQPVPVALSNSFGFGGSNTCLVLKAV